MHPFLELSVTCFKDVSHCVIIRDQHFIHVHEKSKVNLRHVVSTCRENDADRRLLFSTVDELDCSAAT